MIQAEDPAFEPNKDYFRDAFNVIIGVLWQTSLVAIPVYVVLLKPSYTVVALIITVITSIVLKKTWYDHLPTHTHTQST
jgi:hypothetical protein